MLLNAPNLLHDAANYGSVPQPTATFGTLPQDTAAFRNERQITERSENHTLTVKEVARMFESAGVARIERTIVNWCQPNRHGVSRLDAYFDPNERRYLITSQSVDRAIKEELAKSATRAQPAEVPGNAIISSEEKEVRRNESEEADAQEIEKLRFKLRESEIASGVKDKYIAKLEERYDHTHKELLSYSRTVGQLETRLLQLEGPREEFTEVKRVHVVSERDYPGSESDSERTHML